MSKQGEHCRENGERTDHRQEDGGHAAKRHRPEEDLGEDQQADDAAEFVTATLLSAFTSPD